MSELRERVQEITAEYWQARDSLTERVAVAQLILALARAEREAQNTEKEQGPSETRKVGELSFR